jgi:hypothetical protein
MKIIHIFCPSCYPRGFSLIPSLFCETTLSFGGPQKQRGEFCLDVSLSICISTFGSFVSLTFVYFSFSLPSELKVSAEVLDNSSWNSVTTEHRVVDQLPPPLLLLHWKWLVLVKKKEKKKRKQAPIVGEKFVVKQSLLWEREIIRGGIEENLWRGKKTVRTGNTHTHTHHHQTRIHSHRVGAYLPGSVLRQLLQLDEVRRDGAERIVPQLLILEQLARRRGGVNLKGVSPAQSQALVHRICQDGKGLFGTPATRTLVDHGVAFRVATTLT